MVLQFIIGALPALFSALDTPSSKTVRLKNSGSFKWTNDTLSPRLLAASKSADAFLRRTTEMHSLRAETSMKNRAPWTDRTGNARSGLASEAGVEYTATGGLYQIDLYHRVPYGIWLERSRFAIINRTVQSEAPAFFKTANAVFASMFGGK